MALKITKVLGYALTDVVENDPRLAIGKEDLDPDDDASPANATVRDLIDWVQGLPKDDPEAGNHLGLLVVRHLFKDTPGLAETPLHEHIHWSNAERSPAGVLLLQMPSFHKDWTRRDDAIDYYNEMASDSWNDGSPENTLQVLPCGINPYRAWVDDRTGAAIRCQGHAIDPGVVGRMVLSARADALAGVPERADSFAKACGFADRTEFLAHCAPEVPGGIQALARHLGLFRDSATVRALRPVLWTYWA